MPLPTAPKSAAQFIAIMESIWDGELASLYDDFHNARVVLRHYGIARLYGNVLYPGKEWELKGSIYKFADGSKVTVYNDGSGIVPVKCH